LTKNVPVVLSTTSTSDSDWPAVPELPVASTVVPLVPITCTARSACASALVVTPVEQEPFEFCGLSS
jgi:hypothetical protein